MYHTLELTDIERIADVLGVEARQEGDHWTLILDDLEQALR